MGKGKDPHVEPAQDHHSRPLASLKDPSTFGPPPKHVKYHGDAVESQGTKSDATESVTPLSEELREPQKDHQGEEGSATRSGPPIPDKVDTPGLSTRNPPKPPSRYAITQSSPITSPVSPSPKPKPALPPRLPPRQASTPSPYGSQEVPPPYSTIPSEMNHVGSPVNRGALSRLHSAGIRVPGLGIGEEPTGSSTGQGRNNDNRGSLNVSPSGEQGTTSQSLQSRFSKLSTKQSSSASPTEVPAQGTSFAQKQAALKTASAFRKDPTSISLSDAKATAATAHNFRERHGEQVAAGWQAGNALNKKYDIASKLNDHARADNDASPSQGARDSGTSDPLGSSSFGTRGKPPPPVPKKPFLEGNSAPTVPPVPWSSKPKS